MPAPKRPNTTAATNARRDPQGRVSKPVRILASAAVHEQLAQMTPGEIGDVLAMYLASPARARAPAAAGEGRGVPAMSPAES